MKPTFELLKNTRMLLVSHSSCIILLFLGIILYATPVNSLQTEVVVTASGPVVGQLLTGSDNITVSAYYGIPYAKPPVANLRFAPPQEVTPWTNVLNASSPKPECYQQFNGDYLGNGTSNLISGTGSEDCLTLNVLAPYPKPSNASVLIYIHGGGPAASSLSSVDHTILSSQGVVVVAVNYRFGIFGFFSLGNAEAPGNVGLLDQVLAMKWVQNSIEAFGGDKSKVTLWGASGGSVAVGYHLLSSRSQGLFHRVIMISGTPISYWAFQERERVIKKSETIMDNLNCSNSLVCTRGKSPEETLKAALQPNVMLTVHVLPTLDGTFLTEPPLAVVSEKRFNRAQVIIGTSIDDVAVMLKSSNSDVITSPDGHIDRVNFHTVIKRSRPDMTDSEAQVLNALYTNWSNPDDPVLLRDAAKEIYNDGVVVCGLNDFSDALADYGNDVYRYVFDHKTAAASATSPSWIKATHTSEQDILIGNSQRRFNETADDLEVRRGMLENFLNFIKTGNPNDPNAVYQSWPKYHRRTSRPLKRFSVTPVVENNFRIQECTAQNKILSILKEI